MILQRLAIYLDTDDCLADQGRRLVKIFVTFNILTFLAQEAGTVYRGSSGSR